MSGTKPVWLWFSGTGTRPADVDRCWQSFLRRFDLEHTFRLYGQVLGWATPKIRDPAAADRWTWLIMAAYAQLRLARALAANLRLSWERPAPAGRLTRSGSAAGSGTSARPSQPGQCAETRHARPGQATRVSEPPPRTTPRRGKNRQKELTLEAKRERAG